MKPAPPGGHLPEGQIPAGPVRSAGADGGARTVGESGGAQFDDKTHGNTL